MKSITPKQLEELQDKKENITIVDVRTPEEYNGEHIVGSINLPLDRFEEFKEDLKKYEKIVCYCNSGRSSSQFCKRAEHYGLENVTNLAGGIGGCNKCKKIKRKGSLPMMQQVQIVAGGLVLTGIILAILLHKFFLGLSIFVGAGLVFAGISGWCGMAKILARMPWNALPDNTKKTEIKGNDLIIKQFEDKNLAHYSYIAISNGEAIIVDPERNPAKYYDYAMQHQAKIVGVFNTHPHADFASGHLQIHEETGATIYVGDKVGADYPHTPLKGSEEIKFGNASVMAYFTPGHSPDSLSYLIKDKSDKQLGFFTGDWVFIGDLGRADLRENVGNIKAKQAELAGMMYDTTRSILPEIDKNSMILPAHGAGTSCGKGLSKQNMDTVGNQLKLNPMLQSMTREEFINELTSDQPSIPAYFTNSVLLNKKGNTNFNETYKKIKLIENRENQQDAIIIDTRTIEQTTNYPLSSKSINIGLHSNSFIGMLGTIVNPTEKFIIITEKKSDINKVISEILSIGYETNLLGIYCIEQNGYQKQMIHKHDLENTKDTVIIDIRSTATSQDNPLDLKSINIPLDQLSSKLNTLDKTKIYIPYCGGTYKSAIASSLLTANGFKTKNLYSE